MRIVVTKEVPVLRETWNVESDDLTLDAAIKQVNESLQKLGDSRMPQYLGVNSEGSTGGWITGGGCFPMKDTSTK